MIKLLLLSWGVVHSNLGLAHADSHLLCSQQGFVFLTILASKVLSLLYLDEYGTPGIKHQGAGAVTARVS